MLKVAFRRRNYEDVAPAAAAKQVSQRAYYTLSDLAKHSHHYDCWVAVNGTVLDLTPLIIKDGSELSLPIVEAAGTDISRWFDAATGDPKILVEAEPGVARTILPLRRFIHVPPSYPCAEWSTKIGCPWWKDNKFIIGKLTTRARKVRIVNMLTEQSVVLECPSEDILNDIKEKYCTENQHAGSYIWTYLGKPLQMEKTLEKNGIPDEIQHTERLRLPAGDSVPTLHLQFRDDLTVA